MQFNYFVNFEEWKILLCGYFVVYMKEDDRLTTFYITKHIFIIYYLILSYSPLKIDTRTELGRSENQLFENSRFFKFFYRMQKILIKLPTHIFNDPPSFYKQNECKISISQK